MQHSTTNPKPQHVRLAALWLADGLEAHLSDEYLTALAVVIIDELERRSVRQLLVGAQRVG